MIRWSPWNPCHLSVKLPLPQPVIPATCPPSLLPASLTYTTNTIFSSVLSLALPSFPPVRFTLHHPSTNPLPPGTPCPPWHAFPTIQCSSTPSLMPNATGTGVYRSFTLPRARRAKHQRAVLYNTLTRITMKHSGQLRRFQPCLCPYGAHRVTTQACSD
jgi:hypothetical protein